MKGNTVNNHSIHKFHSTNIYWTEETAVNKTKSLHLENQHSSGREIDNNTKSNSK